MSILNIALQGIGIVRNETSYDDQLQSCNNMKEVRNLAERFPELKVAVIDSVQDMKALVYSLFMRLKLKDESFLTFHAASQEDLAALQEKVKVIDDSIDPTDTRKQSAMNKEVFHKFYDEHCKSRQYMFSVKKCGKASCKVCKCPRLPLEVFEGLHHMPDPVPSGEKYQDFSALYGQPTSEKYCPSLTGSKSSGAHSMPFPPSAQYAKNVKVVL